MADRSHVRELDVALGDDDLYRAAVQTEPHRRRQRCPILPVRRQHGGGGAFEK
jgi:hypothetical protein